jgi:hypothetical protein
MVLLPNVNKPVTVFEADMTAGPPNVAGTFRVSIDNPANKVFVRKWNIARGRQYELDQVQTGTASLDMADDLENLNPLNTASPYNTSGNTITAYRCLRIGSYWPTTGNVFCSTVSSSYDPSFESGVSTFTAGGGTTLASSGVRFQFGTKSLLVTQGGNTVTAWPTVKVPGVPGYTATVSVYAYLSGGCSLQIKCPDGANSTVLSTATTWTRMTVTYIQVNALDTITFAGTAVATPTYNLDGFQVEWAAAATTFSTSGPTFYPLYNGYIERYPTTYDMAGARSCHSLEAVDGLATLSRVSIAQAYATTIMADDPLFYLPLDNAGSSAQGNMGGVNTNNWVPFELPNSQNGAIQWSGDSNFDGTPAVVINQKNSGNPDPVSTGAVIDNSVAFLMVGPPLSMTTAAATMEVWFKYSAGFASGASLSSNFNLSVNQPNTTFIWVTAGNGRIVLYVRDLITDTYQIQLASTVNPAVDGAPNSDWHYFAITMYNSAGSPAIKFMVDGVEQSYSSPFTDIRSIGYGTVATDAFTGWGDPISQGSVSRVGVYNSDIGNTARVNHYQRGVGYIDEVSGARVSRLLTQYWTGTTSVATGYLHMAPDFDYNGRTLLEVLQEIQESERGLVYVNKSGTVIFEDRVSRYSAGQVSLWTFGENPSGASLTEYPYIEYAADFDPTYTFTQCNLSRPGNSDFSPVVNAASQTKYGQRVLTQTLQTNTDFDLTQAGIFYLDRYADPTVRISTLVLNPAANPALWPVVLSLEISQRVTVKRRTSNLTTSNEYYIEQINHDASADSGEWNVSLQLSPVFVPTAWVLGNSTYGVLGTTTVPVY